MATAIVVEFIKNSWRLRWLICTVRSTNKVLGDLILFWSFQRIMGLPEPHWRFTLYIAHKQPKGTLQSSNSTDCISWIWWGYEMRFVSFFIDFGRSGGGILGRAVLGRSIYDSWPHYKKKEGFDLIFFSVFCVVFEFYWVFEKYRQKSFKDFLARKSHKFK